MKAPLWKPSEDVILNSRMTTFTNWLNRKLSTSFSDYPTLHKWTTDNIADFWEAYFEFSKIIYATPHENVVQPQDMPGAKWFSGMYLNFTENIFHTNLTKTALIYQIERSSKNAEPDGSYTGEVTYDKLRTLVSRCARGLKKNGIKKGDRVAGYVANVPEAVVAFLACASIGAVWSSASPDFGLNALCDRLGQIEPKLLFVSTHYKYGGKIYRTDETVRQLHDKLPSVATIVSIPYPVAKANTLGDVDWERFLGPDDTPTLTFEHVPFEHPLYILFSSGTTGAPKCIVHGTGGPLLQQRKELELHSNITEKSFLLFFTTCGWMMWNWQVSALQLGATIGLYDGNPGYPDLSAIWRLVDQLRVTHFGTSGRFIESCMKKTPPIPAGAFGDMPRLQSILYTGSSLSKKGFHWIYDTIKEDVHLAGISGGTDIVSCFILGNPNLPVYAGEIQCKGLGVDVHAFDQTGKPVTREPGELVCRKPLPSMPIEFLNDPGHQKYHDAYFDLYPGIWRHGDYVEFTENGGIVVHGRSDATLNPGGVRIGSAEIYSALDHILEIAGSLVVGWTPPGQSDEIIVLFVVLSRDKKLDQPLEKMIRKTIRESCSPRHVPQRIFQISEVPVTRSGKTVELSVKAILAGKAIANRSALANPQVLEEFGRVRQELLSFY
ncbi:MAG: acetoacetate--CoA ligase [bacterium]